MLSFDAIVQPPGVLHVVPATKQARIDFSKAHKLRNAYLCNMLGVGTASQDEASGFQKLGQVKWLVHIETGERVPVVGKITKFLKTPRAQRKDMAFNADNLRELFAGELLNGSGIKMTDVTGLETGGRFVVTTRYNIRLNESDTIVEIEPESSALGHTVTWFSPFA